VNKHAGNPKNIEIATIFALQLALCGAVIQDDDAKVSAINNLLSEYWLKDSLRNLKYIHLNMQALIAAQQGRLSEARNALVPGINANSITSSGFFSSFDYQLAHIMVTAESGDHQKGIDALEQLHTQALSAKNYPVAIAALGRQGYLHVLLGRNSEAITQIATARDLITFNNLSPEMHDAVDIWEARVQYWLRDERRVEELLSRSNASYLMRAFKAGIHINSNTPKKALEITETFDLKIPRQELTYYLFRAHIFFDSDSAQLREVSKAVEVGSKHGYFNHFLTQRSDVIQKYITLVAQSPTTFNERLARAAGERLNEMMVGNQEQALTRREADILRHLATGIPIAQIAINLSISKNTMKTHLKNIYKKLEVSGRVEAVEKGKKLFKV
jgi:ATP/maltotriose-dependent transcriptional regulator MalT